VGALLILDEIQTGMGRTGSLFAFEQLGIVPDVLLLAKAFGGGMPISALVSSSDNLSKFTHDPVLGHITTFGGHPVCAAAALANLEVISENKFYKNAIDIETYFMKHLFHEKIKSFRSFGALMAVEFHDEKTNMEVIKKCIEKGVFVDWFLFNTKAMRLAPPLIISNWEMKKAIESINQSINEVL
jgi:acetylornithine/succinyldiaminopimelate/putrescine aminotransferase